MIRNRCPMAFDYILSGAVTLFITAYLVYALWRPERF
jgi:K+-transporting ATPase KdpF subunit